jgi:hypothetical protein
MICKYYSNNVYYQKAEGAKAGKKLSQIYALNQKMYTPKICYILFIVTGFGG